MISMMRRVEVRVTICLSVCLSVCDNLSVKRDEIGPRPLPILRFCKKLLKMR